MPKYKLTDATKKDSIKFNLGLASVVITKEGTEVKDEFVKSIQRDYPGWIEPVETPTKKAEVAAK